MDIELTLGLIGFAFATLIVPGPNNLLLMSSGAAFGFRRTVPHLLGAIIGFNLLIAVAAIGLGGVLLRFPQFAGALKLGAAVYLVWMGGRFIGSAISLQKRDGSLRAPTLRPFNVTEAALFQWINPSALILVISTVSAFAAVAESITVRLMIFSSVFSAVALFATITWAGMGASLSAIFETPTTGRVLRAGMGLLIVATAIFVFQA